MSLKRSLSFAFIRLASSALASASLDLAPSVGAPIWRFSFFSGFATTTSEGNIASPKVISLRGALAFLNLSFSRTRMLAGLPAVVRLSPTPLISQHATHGVVESIVRAVGEPMTCIPSILTCSAYVDAISERQPSR